jgi:hypothetical protein
MASTMNNIALIEGLEEAKRALEKVEDRDRSLCQNQQEKLEFPVALNAVVKTLMKFRWM